MRLPWRDEPEAGRTASAYYRTALRGWRAGIRLPLLIAVALALALSIPVWRFFPHGQFFAGMIIGGAWGMIVWVWDDPPEFIAKWNRGAQGERRTERVLARLEQHGWHTVHDRAGKYGNLDHIAVGHGGIFLLDSKNLFGTVALEEGGLTTTYADSPNDGFTNTRLAGAMRGRSVYLKERITETTGLTYRVRAVVVIWGHFPEGEAERDNVAYVCGDQLAAWLSRQPTRLSPRDQQLIRLALDAEVVVPRATPLTVAAEPK